MGPGSSPGTGKISNLYTNSLLMFCFFWTAMLVIVGYSKKLWVLTERVSVNLIDLDALSTYAFFDFTTLHVIFIWSFITIILYKSR